MQIASILSDLTSLRVCDHSAALALVSVHKNPEDTQKDDDEKDKDMQRATDLMDLHYGVKVKYAQGDEEELKQARSDVDAVVQKLERKKKQAW